jgi:iron complex outermembrane receptor protein
LFGTGKSGSRWRASVYANYSRDNHNLRWTTRLISAVDDDRADQTYAGIGADGIACTTCGGSSSFGQDGEDYYVSDFNWTWDTPWLENFQLRLSILNVFDTDPAPYRGANTGGLPYNPYIYSPYGRQWEIGFSKTF